MKKRTTFALLGVLALTGCAGTTDYVEAVRASAPQVLDRGTESELRELGENVCGLLEDGDTPDDVKEWFQGLGFSVEESNVVVDEAGKLLCPELI
jgi:hypothetical protein